MGGEFIDGRIYNATQNRYHSYFLFDDRQVGNLGNDGIDRIDYVKELAQNQAPAGARNDDRHKRFTPVGGVDFDQNYQPINSLYPTAAPGSYIVKAGETLQSIATAVWGDGAMWYLLADANGLAPNQPLIANTVLTVPNKVTNIHNNAGTFKPYDAGAAMGNTSPTLPEPPPPPAPKKGGCGGFVMVLAVVVAVIVTIYTAGAAAGAFGVATGTATTTFGAGLAVLGGSGGLTLGAVGAAVIGGAVGSIASQAVMIAGGEQNGFDWKQVGLSALGSGVTAGVAGSSALGGVLDKVGKVAGGFGRAAASGAVNSAVTNGLASALDVGSFNWKNVAISAASSGVGYAVGQGIGRLQYGAEGWANITEKTKLNDAWATGVRNFVSGAMAGATSAAARGNLSGAALVSVGLDALGSTIGNSIAEQSAGRSAPRVSNTEGRDATDVSYYPFGLGSPASGADVVGSGTVSFPAWTPEQALSPRKFISPASRLTSSANIFGAGADPTIKTLPPLVVTPDERFSSDYMQLWAWSTQYRRAAPPVTASQVTLNEYRRQQFNATAPHGDSRSVPAGARMSLDQQWDAKYGAPLSLKRAGGGLIGALEGGIGMVKEAAVGGYELLKGGASMVADGFGESLALLGVDTEYTRAGAAANEGRRRGLVNMARAASAYQSAYWGNMLYTAGVDTPYTEWSRDLLKETAGRIGGALAEPFAQADAYEAAGDPISAARLRSGSFFKYGMTAVTALREAPQLFSGLMRLSDDILAAKTLPSIGSVAGAGLADKFSVVPRPEGTYFKYGNPEYWSDVDSSHGLWAIVDKNGELGFNVFANPELRATHGSGTDMFNGLWQRIEQEGIQVNGIRGSWIHGTDSVNHAQYLAGRAKGLSPEQSALNTWTGLRAQQKGFTSVQMLDERKNVYVMFSKPKN